MSITLGIFIIILAITLGITYWAATRTSTTADFYAADSKLTAAENGFALAGDWCSACCNGWTTEGIGQCSCGSYATIPTGASTKILVENS